MSEMNSRSRHVLAGADLVARIVVLNLCFLLTSVGVVTIVPSALALQSVLPRPGVEPPARPVRSYFRTFAAMWRCAWPLGVLLPSIGFGAWVAVSFYLAAAPFLAGPALAVLIPAFGGLAAGYLALLEVARRQGVLPGGWRGWLAPTVRVVASRPLPAAGAILLLGTVAMLFLRLPTLLPIACGAAPAYIAMWAFGLPARRSVTTR
jgi:uncharacterized membrane protein YesL